MNIGLKSLCLCVSAYIMISCVSRPENPTMVDEAAPIYPDYRDVTIPVNIAPLNFLVRGAEAVEVKAGELTLNANGDEVVFDMDDWSELMEGERKEEGGKRKEISVSVTALVDGKWQTYKPFTWTVVDDRIDPYLTYRLIEPDYEIYNHLQIQQRCVENFETSRVSHYEDVGNRCMNCHTYAHQDPQLSMMYVRGEGGGAVLNRGGQLRKLNIPGSVYFGFSKTGRYVVYSTNKIIPGFHTRADKRLEVYDAQSNVFVADLQENRILSSPLLSDSLVFETFPTFSPDGKYIYYCAADSVALPSDIHHLKYALVRIPFDETTGTIGDRRERWRVEGGGWKEITSVPSSDDKSICHPRISPDGRYLLYTVADYGTFPIWHPEADLQMIDLQTGRVDSLAIVNSQKSDTYHSWSSNSRWFVFASKRDDGLYGKPYFCYVDRNGKAHKPFCLPQKYPHFYDNNLKSFNVPELGRGPLPFSVNDVAKAMKQAPAEFK